MSRCLSRADLPVCLYANPLFYLSSLIPKRKSRHRKVAAFSYKLKFILLTSFNVFVGADAHIGPIGGFFIRADVGIGPYG